jgi:hypothetical protein
MNRTRSAALVALVTLTGFALPALSQDADARLEKLKQLREAARQAALSAAARNPPPTATTPPPTATPPPTFRITPPPPPTNPPPPPTTTASTVPAASASSSAKKIDAPKVALPAPTTVDKLRSTRQERRHAEVERLQQRWGELLSDDRAKAELKLHAQRVAYLQRIRSLAEKSNDPKLLESVDQLITQEERRDADVMNTLRSGAPGGAK